MKKTYLILIALLLCRLTSQAQWTQTLTGQTSLIDEISVVNDNVIWVTDQDATTFSISTDGGTSWQTKNFPTEINGSIGNISAVNATTAFVVFSMGTNIGIYKTTDSGNTWTRQSAAFNSVNSFLDMVYFWNANEGVAIGDGGTNPGFEIYTTSDGGNQWNQVSYNNMPAISNSYTYNASSEFKVLGNSFYFATNSGQIMKSTDKGLTWTLINTPSTSIVSMSFDFKDENNGLLSDYNYSTKTALLYSTTNGGATWSLIKTSTSESYPDLRYIPSQNAYTSSGTGMSYSTDNGLNWIKNTSFQNMSLGQMSYTPSGKLILGGNRYIYSSTSISGVNISVANAKISGLNTIDITYSANPDAGSSQNLANYTVSYIKNKVPVGLAVLSALLDATNKSIIHIQMQSNLPLDTIKVNLGDIKDSNGVSVLNKNIVFYNTSKTIQVNTAGTLFSLFTADDLANITDLTITGIIDARDFKTMRDNMPLLTKIDLMGANIVAYTGTEGTYGSNINTYPANEIPSSGFWPKDNLASIVLPLSITSIGEEAFVYCNSIKSIFISQAINNIGSNAFDACSAMIVVDPANQFYSGIEGVLFDKNITTLMQCPTIKTGSYIIPSTVKTIGDWAFENVGINSITFPVSVTAIQEGAFYNCKNLNSIFVSSTTPIDISTLKYVFSGINKSTCTLNVPIGSKTNYQTAEQWKDFTNIVEFSATDVKTVNSNNIKLMSGKSFIRAEFEGSAKVEVYNLSGLLLKQANATSNITIDNLKIGIYIVTINKRAYKVPVE